MDEDSTARLAFTRPFASLAARADYNPLSMRPPVADATRHNTAAQVLFASLIGTAIEFFDFYIYATAAVLVFPRKFFPASDPAAATPSVS